MRWTNEQQNAIRSEGNLIVSAAAGAGKTAVLTERIVSRVAGGANIESMLVLTFTRAAAAEMKARITSRLHALADEAREPEQARRLRSQARAVESAYISTIHVFCSRVLRRHYHAVGLPARCRTADEMESASLKEAVKDELLTELASQEDEDYRTLLAARGGEEQAWETVLQAYSFTRAQPDPDAWLDAAAAGYENPAALNALLADAVDYAKSEFALVVEAIERARDALQPDFANVISVLDGDLARYRALRLCRNYEEYRAALAAIEYDRLLFPRGTPEEEKEPVKTAREYGKDLRRAQMERFARPEQDALSALALSGAVIAALSRIVQRFERAYEAKKRERSLLDFDDLEHLALFALRHETIAGEYRERFQWIAVDEYQDSNRVQEAILQSIARGDNLFFVGDVKQSIYRFRQAEPKLFLEKLAGFSGGSGARIDLTSNFRSSAEVLAAVNETFGAIMQRNAGEVDYDARARLVPGANPPPGGAELHLIRRTRAETEGEADALEDAADLEVESRLIAARIREIRQNEQYFDARSGETRDYRYADFAVLLRAGTDAQTVAETLSQCGIPCYAQTSGGYFDAVEVQILRNLLRVIDNRRQDVPLLSVLASSIGQFTFAELVDVRAGCRTGTFFDAFLRRSAQDDPIGKRAGEFLERLDAYREESCLLSVEELLGKLLDETGFYEEMGALPGGAERQANLNALLDKAHSFERSGARGVWNFLRQLDLAENTASIGAAQTVTADVVRILTIHKSKGLEFPVVFVAGLGKRFNLQDMRNALQLHAQYGAAMLFLDRAEDNLTRVKRDTIARQTLAQRMRAEQTGEEMRILYVAMTRAVRRLVMTACVSNPEEKLAAAPENPSAWSVLKSSCPAQWLLMGPRRTMHVQVHEREAWLAAPIPAAESPALDLPPAEPCVLAALEERLAWEYPHKDALLLGAKVSVSRIGRDEASEPLFRMPAFLGVEKTAAFAGTATHAAMQYLPLERALTGEEIGAYLDALTASGRLTAEQAEAADRGAIEWFLQTPLCARMRVSARLERELAFSYSMEASALYGVDSDEQVLLQGVMDACFLEDGAWTIVDYKTDRVRTDESAAETAARHGTQLSLYAVALEALTKIPVREKLIVLLAYKEVVRL